MNISVGYFFKSSGQGIFWVRFLFNSAKMCQNSHIFIRTYNEYWPQLPLFQENIRLAYRVRALQFPLQIHRSGTAVGAQWNQRGKPQYAGSYLCPDCCVGRRSARLSLLPFCQTASAFRLIYLFHTFFRRGVYRATVFASLRRPKLFWFPVAVFAGCSFCPFCSSLVSIYAELA